MVVSELALSESDTRVLIYLFIYLFLAVLGLWLLMGFL